LNGALQFAKICESGFSRNALGRHPVAGRVAFVQRHGNGDGPVTELLSGAAVPDLTMLQSHVEPAICRFGVVACVQEHPAIRISRNQMLRGLRRRGSLR
jgi:hypothetical protein